MTRTQRQVAKVDRERAKAIRASLRRNKGARALAMTIDPTFCEGVQVVSRVRGYLPNGIDADVIRDVTRAEGDELQTATYFFTTVRAYYAPVIS